MTIRDFTGITLIGGERAVRNEAPVPAGKLRMTITYLEMSQAPGPASPAPRGRKIALMRADPMTVSFYRYLYNTVGEPYLWYERRAMTDEQLGAVVGNENVEIYVLYIGGAPAGYAELDRRKSPDIELAYFGLLPDFLGQGLGRYLLGSAAEAAWRHQPRRLLVNTNNFDHPRALPNYQKIGFVPVRQDVLVFDDPRLNGLIPSHIVVRG